MKGLGLKQYSVPLLAAHVGDLAILPIQFQVAALRIKGRLDFFNQEVVTLQRYFDRTFDSSLSEENRRVIVSNMDQGYMNLAGTAQRIAEKISDLVDGED